MRVSLCALPSANSKRSDIPNNEEIQRFVYHFLQLDFARFAFLAERKAVGYFYRTGRVSLCALPSDNSKGLDIPNNEEFQRFVYHFFQ